jgi:hypothetical protein
MPSNWLPEKLKATNVSLSKNHSANKIYVFTHFIRISAQYPSSSKNPKNWDKIVADATEEEKNEKLEGDAALNK